MKIGDATADYWAYFLEARRNFLEEVLTRAESDPLENYGLSVHRGQMVHSVKWALKCRQTIEPSLCARYVQRWREDLDGWRKQMVEIGEVSVEGALGKLGLASTGRVYGTAGDAARRGAATPSVTAGAAVLPRFETMNQMQECGGALGLASSPQP
jgi:hypothetical protein